MANAHELHITEGSCSSKCSHAHSKKLKQTKKDNAKEDGMSRVIKNLGFLHLGITIMSQIRLMYSFVRKLDVGANSVNLRPKLTDTWFACAI